MSKAKFVQVHQVIIVELNDPLSMSPPNHKGLLTSLCIRQHGSVIYIWWWLFVYLHVDTQAKTTKISKIFTLQVLAI